MSNSFDNNLIYGKDKSSRIVSLEVYDDSNIEIFTENKNGVVQSYYKDHVYWIITAAPIGQKKYTLLDGNLHYKYGYTFNEKNSFFKFKNYLKSEDVDFYSINDGKEAAMVRDGYTYFKDMEIKDVSILSTDIETTGLNHNDDSLILLISNTYRRNGIITRKLFCYDNYDSQGEMLEDWCEWVRIMNPSIITGHNIMIFDLPYMKYIADREKIKLVFGRDESSIKVSNYESKFRKDGSQFYHYHKIHIYGREIIDTLFLSIKYDATDRKFESYGLKQIIKQTNLEDPNRIFYDASQIRFNYKIPEEWQKIKDYCVFDADDALKLFDLTSPAFFYWTQSVPKSFQAVIESATGSQLNSILVRSYLQEKHSIPKADDIDNYEGAISWGGPGIYRNVKKWDIASLYPSIILQYKIYSKVKDPKANFLTMVEFFTKERLKNKKLAKTSPYHNDLQASQKIAINSAYGMLGTGGINFNYLEGAAEITNKGRQILSDAIIWATGKSYEKWNI